MSKDMELGVRVSMDLRNFDSGVAGMNRKLKMVDSEFKAASAEAKRYGDSVSHLRTKMDALAQKLDIQKQKVAHYRQEMEKLNVKQQQLRTASETLVGKVQHLEQAYRKSAQTTGKNSQQTQRLKQELDEVRHKYTMNVQSLSRVNAAIEKNVVSLNRAREGEAKLKHQIQQTNQVMEKQSTLLHRVSEKMKATGHSMQNVGATMGLSFMAGATTLGYALKKTISTAADFESAMSRVAALSGASDVELKKLNDTARQLGSTTSFSASQAAEGMQYLAMAGFKTNDIIAAMPGLLDLAAAGQMELGRAADITSNIMSGFGIAATEAGRVADVLAKASTSANTDVSQLGEAMVYLAPVSKSLGWSLEEATAAVMAMSDAGIQGAQAGAAFSTSMGRLAKPTGEAKDIIDTLNIKLFDQKGTMKSMPNVIRELERATNGMTDQQKSATLTTIFGAEAYKHWSVLIDKSSDALASNTEILKNSAGTAKEIAEKQLANLKGELVNLNSAIEGASISIGNALIPAISALGSGVKSAVDWFNSLDESTQQMIATGAALTVGAMGLVGVLGLMSVAIGGLLANPVVLAIAGVTAAVAGLGVGIVALSRDVQKTTDDISRFGDTVSEGTREAAGAYADLRDKAISHMMQLRTKTGEEANAAAQETIKAFREMTNEVVKELEGKKSKVEKMFGQLMQSVPENTKQTLENVKNNVIASINVEIETAKKAEAILMEGMKRYQGDMSKMPKDFAKQFEEASKVADKNIKVFYQKASELSGVSKRIASEGELSVSAGKKNFSEIIKVYGEGVKGLQKQTKGWREETEKMFKLGDINPEERKATLSAIELYEAEHMSKLIGIRNESIETLRQHLSMEDREIVLANLEKIEKEDAHWSEKLKVAAFGAETYDEVLSRTDKERERADKAHKDKMLEFEARYAHHKIESVGSFVTELTKANGSARLIAESMARDMNGTMKIDLGSAGQYTVDTYIEKLQKGDLAIDTVAIANANKLKTTYQVDLSQSGIDSMNKWLDGMKSKDTREVREFLGHNLQSDTTIDLGVYGQMTADSWITGLQNGTHLFDTVFKYFQDKARSGMTIDASKEGQNNIQTLINGMQVGALSVNDVAKSIGLDIKNETKVDLGKDGQWTVASLVNGMKDGSIHAKTASQAIAELVETEAKIDLTQQGTDTSISYSDGLHAGEGPTREAAQQLSHAAQEELDKTDGVTPANQASNQFSSTLSFHVGQVLQAGQMLGTGATSGMNTVDGATPGVKGGDAFTNAVLARSGASKTAGQSNATNANRGFATIDGVSQGGKGGDGFTNAVLARIGASKTAGQSNATNANRGFATIDGHKPGMKGGTEFTTGVGSQKGSAEVAGKSIATSAKSGAGSVSMLSVGASAIGGMIKGVWSGEFDLKSAFTGVINNAIAGAKRLLEINSPSKRVKREIGHPIGEGIEVGVEEKVDAVKQAAQRLAQASIPIVNPKDLSRATRYLGDTYSGSVSDTRRRTGENPNGLGDSVYNQGNIAVTIPIVLEADGRPIARATYQHVTDYQNRAKVRNSAFIG
ncbi:phage tail tape measure protein, TP901 family, core region [Bacillus cereus VD133]|uniref:Phage tail tape measure protein, TP901 family, core region n=1 Tax=Bacillus cereus VD133 TaxID=1053233 RepID=A0A9W5PLI7_BACCE|nr:phage tail tape measure protein [Bacillus cereus]EOO28613.1 phage tail tape measure protein, TP901 family, core region [Bacillus cereus VD133]